MSMRMKKILSAVSVFALVFLLSGCAFKKDAPEPYSVKLEVWGVFDDSDALSEILHTYRSINPYVQDIVYRKMPIETYKEDLLDALAAGKGPDIFMIRNSWRGSFQDKIATAPEYMVGFSENQYRQAFADVVIDDFLVEGKAYGAPLSADSLALYYNKDIFNAAGIANPPATWESLLDVSQRLTSVDGFGNVNQSGIALGTAYNINRSTDVLNAIMLQMGLTPKVNQYRYTFSGDAGAKALDFYTQFSRIGSSYYAWNPRLHYSLDAFYEGRLGMMINYSWHAATIKQKNAKLNFGVAPMPQFVGTTQPTNFANYWGYVVAKNKMTEASGTATAPQPQRDSETLNNLRVHEAWQFLDFLTLPHDGKITLRNRLSGTSKDFALTIDPAAKYLEQTVKPAARRDIIEKQRNDPTLSAFAYGNLIAKNWYQGNPEAVEAILAEMIESVYRGEKTPYEALSSAENRINLISR